MKNLEEIDCNEELWSSITCNLRNGWGNLENECRFAFQTTDKTITEDDINSAFYDKYPSADQIEVTKVKPSKEYREKGVNYFEVSMIIYTADI